MSGKSALITGITGQDGSYLAELLLSKGYRVYGLIRRLSTPNYDRIAHILDDIVLLQGDLLDQTSLLHAVQTAQPDEVYNLAAQSHVGVSFKQPISTGEYTGIGVTRLLEAIRVSGGKTRFYQASTSEMFGNALESPQNEATTFAPRSPYGSAKLYAHWSTINYRESYGMFACSGILFNHESPRRGIDFVTRKITNAVARIKLGLQENLIMGNLNAHRDWGFAGDYTQAMWAMLQQHTPDDYVIATGYSHSVKDFLEAAFKHVGLNWHKYVLTDNSLYRPSEVNRLVGNASKAYEKLGWLPRVTFEELVSMMVDADMRRVTDENKLTASTYSRSLDIPRHSSLPQVQRRVSA